MKYGFILVNNVIYNEAINYVNCMSREYLINASILMNTMKINCVQCPFYIRIYVQKFLYNYHTKPVELRNLLVQLVIYLLNHSINYTRKC